MSFEAEPVDDPAKTQQKILLSRISEPISYLISQSWFSDQSYKWIFVK